MAVLWIPAGFFALIPPVIEQAWELPSGLCESSQA